MSDNNQKTVLVIDDHDDSRVLLQSLLESRGHRVVLSSNGEVALDVLELNPIDLVISDVLMPVMDGIELCRIIKSSPHLRDIPVVLYSATYAREDDVDIAEKAGADRYIVKPFEPDELLVILEEFLQQAPVHSHNDVTLVSRINPSEVASKYQKVYNSQLVKRLEEEVRNLALKEQEQQNILDTLLDGVITIDSRGTVLTFNRAAERLFGYPAHEIIGQSIRLLIPEAPDTSDEESLRHCLESGRPGPLNENPGCEKEALTKTGERIPVRVTVGELPPGPGDCKRYVCSTHDLTQSKRQEQQLRHSQKMDALGKLTGGIAHDYNNVLGIILGYADLLKSEFEGDSQKSFFAHEILHAAERGIKLTRKILSFSRRNVTDSGKLEINTLLENEKDMLEKLLTAQIRLNLDLAPDLWPTWLDSSDLEDAIINMAINSMHAMQTSGGKLTIRTRNRHLDTTDAKALQLEPGDYVLLSVADTGSGMDPDTAQKIFEPYFSTKGDEGTGLGLSQVYGFTRQSGGTIDVSTTPETGTTLTLYFPRYIGDADDAQAQSMPIDQKPAGHETILVVDDEPALLQITSEILGRHGYRILCASKASDALNILEKEQVDLLLTDMIMPDMGGAELAAIVQQKYPDIKIQLASGYTGTRDNRLLNEKLYREILRKPFQSEALLKRIRQLLDTPEARSA